MIRFVFFAFVSYIAACPLSSNIAMDVTQTNWTSLWTYFIWLFSLAIWAFLFLFVVPLVGAVLIAIFDR